MADFDYHIKLPISQQFNMRDILTKMVSEYKNEVPKDRDVGYYVGELKSVLSSKRYLIILDDVWGDDLWNNLKDILPNANKNGSRVLITSRDIEIEKSAEYETMQYEPKILDDGKSLDLLLRKALPHQEPDKEYPIDLLELANKLSKKCKGLPLALVILGGILSKQPSYPTWERILQTMNWHSDDNDCMRILAMSYQDLPYYLKTCFQYLAFFPEDYVISARCLIRMWVAEGFIPFKDKPMEIMAEDCLEELAKRSMIQVLSRFTNGLIKHFQVHDILHKLAMDEARNENFVTVVKQVLADKKSDKKIRRASLQSQKKDSDFKEYVGPNTRSLFVFVTDIPCNWSWLHGSEFRLLKVLEIVGTKDNIIVLISLGELIHLKYLGLRNFETFSFSFHGMKSLETLELRGIKYEKFDGLWTISTLRHVLVDYWRPIRGQIPNGTTISNLQTLKWVYFEDVCDAKLPNLRTLGIKNDSGKWVSWTNLFQTLHNMRNLEIRWLLSTIPMEIVYPKALPNYQYLQALYLNGPWPENVNVEASLLPPLLIKLTLQRSYLKQNPMPELGKLNSLKKLWLGDDVTYGWKGPIICPEGFRALQYLKVTDSKIKDLTVKEGVMPKLTYLKAEFSLGVHLPPELQHVTIERKRW
ncbi:toMV resistant protein Tm-2 netted virescent-like [Carex rostrata]